jgi:hypothetical protein
MTGCAHFKSYPGSPTQFFSLLTRCQSPADGCGFNLPVHSRVHSWHRSARAAPASSLTLLIARRTDQRVRYHASYSGLSCIERRTYPQKDKAMNGFSLYRTDSRKSHGSRDREAEKPVLGTKAAILGGARPTALRAQSQNVATHAGGDATRRGSEMAKRSESASEPQALAEENILAWRQRSCGRVPALRCQSASTGVAGIETGHPLARRLADWTLRLLGPCAQPRAEALVATTGSSGSSC